MTKIEALEKIEELKKFIEQEDLVWKPEAGEDYLVVHPEGNTGRSSWCNDSYDKGRLEMGNVFKTEEEAQAHKMRLLSMAQRGKPPEKDERYWFCVSDGTAQTSTWAGWTTEYALYWIGNIHKTKEAAEKWGKEFAQYFK